MRSHTKGTLGLPFLQGDATTGAFTSEALPGEPTGKRKLMRANQPVFLIDCTGTLVDDEPLLRDVWQQVYDELRIAPLLPQEEYNRLLNTDWYGVGLQSVHQDLRSRGWIPADHAYNHFGAIQGLVDRSYDLAIDNKMLRLRAGMREVLDLARERGFPVAIPSNDSRDLIHRKFNALGLRVKRDILDLSGDFNCVATPDDGYEPKPAADLYTAVKAETRRQFPHQRQFYITFEDNHKGLEADYLSGMVRDGVKSYARIHYLFTPDAPKSERATHTVSDGVGLVKTVKSLVDHIVLAKTVADVETSMHLPPPKI